MSSLHSGIVWNRLAALCLVLVLAGSSSVARGQDALEALGEIFTDILAPAVEAPAMGLMAPNGNQQQFSAPLKQMLNVELHFVNKVCAPDEAQMAQVRKAGRIRIARIAREYAARQNESSANWDEPRHQITTALAKKIKELMSEEAADRYREEIEARETAKKEAAREMMISIIDQRVAFSPEQRQAASDKLERSWDSQWSRNLGALFYDEYAPMPEERLMKGLLTPEQHDVWKNRVNNGTISFGWEQDLGMQLPWGPGGDMDPIHPELARGQNVFDAFRGAIAVEVPVPAGVDIDVQEAVPAEQEEVNQAVEEPQPAADAPAQEAPAKEVEE